MKKPSAANDKLCIQDPDDVNSVYLVEALLEACRGARLGGGAFAFATAPGARLLLKDETFVKFAKKNAFELIIGIDAITTTAALDAISEATLHAPMLKVRVFFQERINSLFHPKFCWFRGPHGGRLIVGSGNLTIGGLRANWEAFSVTPLDRFEVQKVETVWTHWIQRHSDCLMAADDPRVRARASENTTRLPVLKRVDSRSDPLREGSAADEPLAGPIRKEHVVLIAEIPRSKGRWNQANFDLENYEHFFGAERGTQRRVLLQHVDENGAVGAVENRPSVAVKSHNWRFELAAASGLKYPVKKRPIGVFVRVATRTFRYRLLMPRDPDYGIVFEFLKGRWDGSSRMVRRVKTRVEELRKAWPESPLWRSK